MEFKRLTSPITINGMALKNRMMMPALNHVFAPEGYPNEKLCAYYNTRAEGGASLILIGGIRFDEYGGSKGMLSLADDAHLNSYRVLTEGVKARGAKIGAQLYHSGRYSRRANTKNHEPALSASATTSKYTHEQAREMTVDEIKTVERRWAEAAARAKAVGFDTVEIIGCTGYLIPQFLSELTNFRTDEYGGSWENRMRFAKEVVAAVRAAVGPDYPVIMRIAGNDFMPGGGGLPEAVAFAKEMEKAGIDMLNVTGGWHESRIPQISGELPRAGYSYLAAAIKEAVKIPVAASNRMNDPYVAEEVLALGKSDLVCLGRVMVCEPEWPKKVTEGRVDEIRRCTACNQGCLANSFFQKPLECILNGFAGNEYLYDKVKKPAVVKNILVVGGGPAGAEFAIRAAQRGHKVTLWEKAAKTGGQLPLVGSPSNKKEFLSFIDYQATMLNKSGVRVVCNKEATADDVLAGGFDAVATATGVIPNRFPLQNDSGKIPIYTAHELLGDKSIIPGKNVIVVGGGSVGCEVAHILAERGTISPEVLYFLSINKAEPPETIEHLLNHSLRNVAIVEIQKGIGKNFDPGTGWPLMKDLRRLGVGQYVSTCITSVGDGVVTLEQTAEDGSKKSFSLPCDTIIMAVGSKPNNALYQALEGKVPELYNLGDSEKVGRIKDATHHAVDLAMKI